jgi:UPF0271 protein
VVDLNADLGEGPWEGTSDEALLGIVTSANVACGVHAGDAETMRRVCAAAVRSGVVVGAHVSYADRSGFGRRPMSVPPEELADLVLAQLTSLAGVASSEGASVDYCKPHGALYTTIATDEEQATAVARACAAFRPGLPVLGLPGSVWMRVATRHGLTAVGEAFADRAYAADATLVPRSAPGAVLHDAAAITDRVVAMVRSGSVEMVTGERVAVDIASICVHGDTPGAVAIARSVRAGLEAAGIRLAPFVRADTQTAPLHDRRCADPE